VTFLSDDIYLNVAMTMPKSMANGPGKRAVIWVQGCTIGCPGCYNAFTHPHKIETLASPEKLVDWINSIDDIEGITFSGGEPFEQAEAVADVIELVNSKRNESLSVFIFTGFEFEVLQESSAPAVQRLLSLVDILSAGPFVLDQRDTSLLWRGSRNQQLVYLTERYSQSEEQNWRMESPVEELVLNTNEIQRTGFSGPRGHLAKVVEGIE
jgi:anaerobic ribonucleoside-triphosphate reductase activating protein